MVPKTMQAARLHAFNAPLRLDEIPVPAPRPGEALVRVHACGVCIGDLFIYKGLRAVSLPITLGHEPAGIVVALGPEARGVTVGDRVGIHATLSCDSCRWCLVGQENLCDNGRKIGARNTDGEGAFAEYVRAPVRNLFRLPDHVSFGEATVISSPMATSHHTVQRAGVHPGQSVVVLGGGATGYHAAMLAAVAGATRLIGVDVVGVKLDLLRLAGCHAVIDADREDVVQRVHELTDERGADVVLGMVGGARGIETAIRSAGKGGRVVLVGSHNTPLDLHFDNYTRDILSKEITITTSWGYNIQDIQGLMTLANAKQIDLSRSVSRTLPLMEINQAIEIADKGIGHPIRVVVEP